MSRYCLNLSTGLLVVAATSMPLLAQTDDTPAADPAPAVEATPEAAPAAEAPAPEPAPAVEDPAAGAAPEAAAPEPAPAAQEPAAPESVGDEAVKAQSAGVNEARLGAPPSHMVIRDRWENALDVKFTDFYERSGADVGSPTILLNAEWNYKYPTGTFLGFAASGLPQPLKRTKEDGSKVSYATYTLGLRLAQELFTYRPFRVVLGVNGSRGFLYTRLKTLDDDAKAEVLKYNVVEPSLFVTVYIYKGVEIGVVGSYRIVSVLDEEDHKDVATNDELSSMAYGLTFRTQRF